jgi:hypothetical protein
MNKLPSCVKIGDTGVVVLRNMSLKAAPPLRPSQVTPAATAKASTLHGLSCALYGQYRQAEQAWHIWQGLASTIFYLS